ncbi:MAG TPA: hypothetical protein VFI11_08275 [Anaerolineales bacterium]|nr:hypothetical protein [Anaerolineales bacterium]
MNAASRAGPSGRRSTWAIVIVVAAALASAALFLAWSRSLYRLGFPLDDAWIHQTYARNLGLLGEWSFIPGEQSAGSTSPLWTGLLAVGHALRLEPRGWSYVLGTLGLLATAAVAAGWARRRAADRAWLPAAVALTIAVEWHLVWSAVSGMETILLAGIAALSLSMLDSETFDPFRVGLVIGLGVWVRPDAVLLLGAAAWSAWVRSDLKASRAGRDSLLLVAGVACVFVPYLVFLRVTGGSWWPSTFYAKQAEYAILRESPLLDRLWEVARAPLVGTGGLLALGMMADAIEAARSRRWQRLAPLVWLMAYLAAYAVRLPVTYQHGRYQMPVIPVLIVLGWAGAAAWLEAGVKGWRWVVGRTWAIAVAVVAAAFLLLGARAYAQDVAIIESEMVDTARWISTHTPEEAMLAAHDIGAVGYFGGRDLLDLAGLTDPELIPILRDERGLAGAMGAEGVDYLMTFPGWYPALAACGEAIYTSQGSFSPAAGGENMAVYAWRPEAFAGQPACMLYSP